jgi:hypothetical protein
MKLNDTFCRCAIASGAIIPPEPIEPIDLPLTWLGLVVAVLGSAALWALLAWLVTLVWWLM